uniref:Uncharacterized protein n=1 Tax=Glossina palpalis gambiensis TaxID=67801 RepID=A0A1B0BE05_9MUSC
MEREIIKLINGNMKSKTVDVIFNVILAQLLLLFHKMYKFSRKLPTALFQRSSILLYNIDYGFSFLSCVTAKSFQTDAADVLRKRKFVPPAPPKMAEGSLPTEVRVVVCGGGIVDRIGITFTQNVNVDLNIDLMDGGSFHREIDVAIERWHENYSQARIPMFTLSFSETMYCLTRKK